MDVGAEVDGAAVVEGATVVEVVVVDPLVVVDAASSSESSLQPVATSAETTTSAQITRLITDRLSLPKCRDPTQSVSEWSAGGVLPQLERPQHAEEHER